MPRIGFLLRRAVLWALPASLFAFAARAGADLGPRADLSPLSPPAPDWRLPGLDGAEITSRGFRGKAVLLVNSASLCGFTPQYEGLQALQDKWGPKGLVVVAVPSDDFHQEKDSNAEVKDFCTLTFGLTLPMTEIAHVRGPQAVPIYAWLRETLGFEPRWNFNKVLFDREGRVVGTWGSGAEPLGGEIETTIATLLT